MYNENMYELSFYFYIWGYHWTKVLNEFQKIKNMIKLIRSYFQINQNECSTQKLTKDKTKVAVGSFIPWRQNHRDSPMTDSVL